jgi:hypothetical protein
MRWSRSPTGAATSLVRWSHSLAETAACARVQVLQLLVSGGFFGREQRSRQERELGWMEETRESWHWTIYHPWQYVSVDLKFNLSMCRLKFNLSIESVY